MTALVMLALALDVEAHGGVADTPFAAVHFPEQRGYRVATQSLSVSYDPTEALRLSLRIPWVEAFVQQPAGAIVREVAIGNVAVTAARRFQLDPLSAVVSVTVGAPAMGTASPIGDHYVNAALLLGSALEGWRHPDWFAPGRVPITPGARVSLDRARWFCAAELTLPFLVRTRSGEEPGTSVRAIGVASVGAVRAGVRALEWLSISIDAWATSWVVTPAVLPDRDLPARQFALRPSLDAELSSHATLGVDAVIPLGGALGGRTAAGGAHLALRW